jgi:hypothetical protein
VNDKRNPLVVPILLMVALALTRFVFSSADWMPRNFSAVYALAFCAGVYLRGPMGWWLPLGTLLVTDIVLNVFFYGSAPFQMFMITNYAGFALIIWLGRQFQAQDKFLTLLGGGIFGAILFYLISNTAAWLMNPLYAPKSLATWIQALSTGLPGWPPTWEFFRSSLLSTGVFASFFIGVMKLFAPEPATEEETEESEAEAPDLEPGESQA